MSRSLCFAPCCKPCFSSRQRFFNRVTVNGLYVTPIPIRRGYFFASWALTLLAPAALANGVRSIHTQFELIYLES